MHDQRTFSPAEEDAWTDQAVLSLLLEADAQRPWSEDEVARQIGRHTKDSLNRLYSAGLIHSVHGFVWATRTAVIADKLTS